MRLLYFNLATDSRDPVLGFATQWLNALARRVEHIRVITMRAGNIDVPDNVRVYSVGKEKGFSEPRRAFEFYRLLRHVIRENQVDICFSHMIPIFTILAAPVLRSHRIPIVTWYAHRQLTKTLKLAHYCSERMVASAATAYPYKRDKLTVVGQGIDTELFSPSGCCSQSMPLLLSVGRLSPIKGLMTLIDAVHLLRSRGYLVQCALVGEAPKRDETYEKALRQKVQALHLEKVVQFVGPLPNESVVHWYRQCYAHVNCSPSDHSLDKAVLEAMACGKVSLSSTVGFEKTMGRWANRLIFRHADPEDLALRLQWLLDLEEKHRHSIGLEMRQKIVCHHSLTQLTENLFAIFKGLLTKQSILVS